MRRMILAILWMVALALNGLAQEGQGHYATNARKEVVVDLLFSFKLEPTGSGWKIKYPDGTPFFRFVRDPSDRREYAIEETISLSGEKAAKLVKILRESLGEGSPSGWIGTHPEFVISTSSEDGKTGTTDEACIFLISFKNSSVSMVDAKGRQMIYAMQGSDSLAKLIKELSWSRSFEAATER